MELSRIHSNVRTCTALADVNMGDEIGRFIPPAPAQEGLVRAGQKVRSLSFSSNQESGLGKL